MTAYSDIQFLEILKYTDDILQSKAYQNQFLEVQNLFHKFKD